MRPQRGRRRLAAAAWLCAVTRGAPNIPRQFNYSNFTHDFLNPKNYTELQYFGVELEVVKDFLCEVPVASALVRDGYVPLENENVNQSLAAASLLDAATEAASAANLTYEPEMKNYALGDCFNGVRTEKKCGSLDSWGRETLAVDYADAKKENPLPHRDYATLQKVMDAFRERHPSLEVPPKEALVVHLRLGDVISRSPVPVDYLVVCSGPASNYHTLVKSAYEYLYDAKKAGKNHIILVAGSHHAMDPDDPSWRYAFAIKLAFERAGYDPVELRLKPQPDEDFIYLSHARAFIEGTGGYSKYVAQFVKRNHGSVFGRHF
mmetsp:Transcript_15749/g.47634  ORF Transcript_15749/g.47634 Transcript_15749/m.47634 type:complete len:320 (-) Transcript_15749:1508-2467(-)